MGEKQSHFKKSQENKSKDFIQQNQLISKHKNIQENAGNCPISIFVMMGSLVRIRYAAPKNSNKISTLKQ